MVTRLGDVCVLFSADLSLIPATLFSQVFSSHPSASHSLWCSAGALVAPMDV